MAVNITHYLVSDFKQSEIYFLSEDYTGSNAFLCNVSFAAFFSEYIVDIPEPSWITKLIGVTNKETVEKLHSDEVLDILKLDKVVECKRMEEFYTYASEVFMPAFQEEFETANIYSEQYYGEEVFFLNLLMPEYKKGVYVEMVDWISVDVPSDFLEQFQTECLYCIREDFEKVLKALPAEHKKRFDSLYDSYFEVGKSILVISEV
jgi:hypothetical protein